MGRTGGRGWTGRGTVQMAQIDGALVLRVNRLTTQGGRLQKPIRDFFRNEGRKLNKDYAGRYDVTIWIETSGAKRVDVDNVAKACLDALTGAVWRDDSQVSRLTVEKLVSDRDQIVIRARKHAGGSSGDLSALLQSVERNAGA